MMDLTQQPTPSETFDLTMDDGAVIRVRRHGKPDGLRLFLSHGNGFAINAYYPFWGPLADRFDLVLFDMRNHGLNPRAGFDGHHYARLAQDLGQLIDGVEGRLGAVPKAGIFHSASARAAMKHATETAWRWDALVLFDPPNVPPKDHAQYEAMRKFEMRLVEFAVHRPESFSSIDELAATYAENRGSRNWVDGMHRLMAESVLRHDEASGRWKLVCPPEYEAAIYLAALAIELWPPAGAYGGPVKLIGADPETRGVPTGAANRALAKEGGYTYEAIEGTGHLLQIERPEACVEAVLGFLADCGLSGE